MLVQCLRPFIPEKTSAILRSCFKFYLIRLLYVFLPAPQACGAPDMPGFDSNPPTAGIWFRLKIYDNNSGI